MTALILFTLLALGQDPNPPAQNLGLVMVYDDGIDSNGMENVLRSLVRKGYSAVKVNGMLQQTKDYLKHFGFRPKSYPYFMMSRGHEIVEVFEGTSDEDFFVRWFERVRANRPPATVGAQPQVQTQNLAPENRVYLRRRLTPGSCGMLGCINHGGAVFIEQVDAAGNVLGRQRAF